MPIQAKADNNVPKRPGRSFFQPVGVTPMWVFHRGVITGEPPETNTKAPNELDPVLIDGRMEFASLTKGGLFTLQAKAKQAIEVMDVVLGGGTLTITSLSAPTTAVRPTPSAMPYKVAPGEVLRISGGTGCGILMRLVPSGDL